MRLVPFFVQASFGVLFELFSFVFYDLEFKGLENIKKADLPFIYVCNHKSWIDHFVIIAGSLCRRGIVPIHLLVDDEVWETPVFGQVTWLLGAYPANRGKGIEISLAPLKKDLAKGECVGLYPEGGIERRKDAFREPKVGPSYLAYHTGRKIVPMAIKGLENLSTWSLFFGGRRVTLKFGQPFRINSGTVGGNTPEETIERGKKYMMERIIELYRSIPG